VKRQAALATAYTISESALREYQAKVVETIGEKKEQGVRAAIAKDKIDQNPASQNTIIITGKGGLLCYDGVFGQYFESDNEKIRRAQNELNRQMIHDTYVSLNDFYYALGIPPIPAGDDLGWNVNKGLIDCKFSAQLSEGERPCLVIDYMIRPLQGYDK
jgi:hypothetical protein